MQKDELARMTTDEVETAYYKHIGAFNAAVQKFAEFPCTANLRKVATHAGAAANAAEELDGRKIGWS